MTQLRKYSISVTLLLLFTLYIAVQLVYSQMQSLYIGLDVKQGQAGEWKIINVDRQAWGSKNGIEVGDVLYLIDGEDPNLHSSLKYNSVEQIDNLEVVRNGEHIKFTVPVGTHSPITLDQTVLPATLFVLLFIFSFILYYKKREDHASKMLILFFLSIALAYLAAGAAGRRIIYAQMIVSICLSLSPVFFMHFLYSYFKEYRVEMLKPKLLVFFYSVNTVIFALTLLVNYTDINIGVSNVVFSRVPLIAFSIGNIVAIYILVARYVKYRGTIYRPLFKYLVVGNAVSFFPFIVLYVLPKMLFGIQIIPANVAAMCLLFLPVVYVYLIISNRLLDIDFIIGRLRYYSFLAIIPALLIVIGVKLVQTHNNYVLLQWVQSFLLVYLGIIMLLYFKESLDFKLSGFLFKEKRNFQASLNQFSQQISKIMRASDLEERLIKEVLQVMPTKSVAIIEQNMLDKSLTLRRVVGSAPSPQILEELQKDPHHYEVGEVIRVSTGICCIIGRRQDSHYMMWMDSKENRMGYNVDEMLWMKTVSNYVSIVYENLELIEGIISNIETDNSKKTPSWIVRLLFRLSEQERRRLASDLHDSALQDQLLWYRKFEALLDESDTPPEMRERMVEIKEGLLDVIHQIRETCNELRPPFLKEIGVVEAVDNLCSYAQLNANYVVDFDHKGFDLELDDEYVLILYRITQELLRNTMKHARATKVELHLHHDDETITYVYRDNGIGMDLSQLQSSFKHMGLSGVRERIAGLEGTTSFHSSFGEGFEVRVSIPYQRNLSSIESNIG
ncbi:histidine kinase [Paenibacillus sp. N1-5-1-14]|uniref:sensor histidine kinase n=1 Tax=Paenibacillus radicibacter TaxID=2972488 RepID=UPI0021598B3B|nr:ATP-binding protein [Paenibacillus radicibacter]MCR8643559.1 histidine kinase [Paenibacillus radicibacter]